MTRDRLLVVVQRYGEEIVGGAESYARLLSERLMAHVDVEVATTTAIDYWTWKEHHRPGESVVNGVPVRRFHIERERSADFQTFSRKVLLEPHSLADEDRWIRDQGPECPDLLEFLHREGRSYDLALFFGYLYYPTVYGLPLIPERALLVPTAHDEAPIRLTRYRALFHLPQAMSFSTIEERDLVHGLFRNAAVPHDVIAVGIDEPADPPSAERFRQRYGIERPFLLYFGRIVESKGADELLDFWTRLKDGPEPPDLDLVLAGKTELPIPDRKDIKAIGFVDDRTKWDMLAAATAFVLPSRLESLSIVVNEAWWSGKPVIVHAQCLPLVGQVRRSGGGLYYDSYGEFAEAVRRLADDAALRDELGRGGQAYVRENYAWPVVEEKFLDLFAEVRYSSR